MFGKVVYYPKTWKSVINMTSFRRFGYGTVSFIGKKELEDKIASNDMRLEKEKSKLDAIPTMNGFANVAAFKKALKKAKADLTAKAPGRMEKTGSKTESCILVHTCECKKRAGTGTATRRKEISGEAWN